MATVECRESRGFLSIATKSAISSISRAADGTVNADIFHLALGSNLYPGKSCARHISYGYGNIWHLSLTTIFFIFFFFFIKIIFFCPSVQSNPEDKFTCIFHSRDRGYCLLGCYIDTNVHSQCDAGSRVLSLVRTLRLSSE